MVQKKIIERPELEPTEPVPRLSQYYAGKTIFVTGFTGFLAQVLVEKLLWLYPDIKCFYLLIRSKKTLSSQQRLDNILSGDLFSRLRERDDSFRNKLIPIEGDITLPQLGLSQKNRLKMLNDVNIVVHSAATTNFNDFLTTAIDINIKGTQQILDIASCMPHLQVLSHYSTAYCNSQKISEVIEEKVYEPLYDWNIAIKIRDKIQPATINILADKLKHKMPNTYTFTKHMSEHMVYEYADRLPIVILRPSVVTPTMFEPFPGFCVSEIGLTGLMLGYSTGIVRANYINPNIKIDSVPCDYVSNATIFATALRSHQRKDVKPIYNLTGLDISPSIGECFNVTYSKCVEQLPVKYCIWKPNTVLIGNYTNYFIHFVLYQLLPALVLDILLKVSGIKISLARIQRKAYSAAMGYKHFCTSQYYFDFSNTYLANKYLREEDRKDIKLLYKPEDIDAHGYHKQILHYLRIKFFDQKPQDEGRARKLARILKVLDYVLKRGLLLFVIYYAFTKYSHLPHATYQFLINFN